MGISIDIYINKNACLANTKQAPAIRQIFYIIINDLFLIILWSQLKLY